MTRFAVVSDIHGNRTAFEAVLADLGETSPDLVLHAGDLAGTGSDPAEVIDRVRALGWPGVMGNSDEMLARPESLEEFASRSLAPASLWSAVREMADWERERIGEERIEWLSQLPRVVTLPPVSVVHASPETLWIAPGANASDDELRRTYARLESDLAVYGHVHTAFARRIGDFTVANAGSVGLPFDGDPRASYLLIDDGRPSIRRVAYDVECEIERLSALAPPHWEWAAKVLRAARQ